MTADNALGRPEGSVTRLRDGAVLGVDGCPGGWIGARIEHGDVRWLLLPDAAAVLDVDATAVGIDVPIGLPDETLRACDLAARRLLGRPRASSVFPSPVRAVLGATSYPHACALARATSGRALSRQTYNILSRIADVDARLEPEHQARVIEVHPEASFRLLAGRDLDRKRNLAGRAGREEALRGWLPGLTLAGVPAPARPHDALDALACAWTASRWLRGAAVVLPDAAPPARDSRGLKMQIVA